MLKSLWIISLFITLATAKRTLLNETVEEPFIEQYTRGNYRLELDLSEFISCANLSSIEDIKILRTARYNQYFIQVFNTNVTDVEFDGWYNCLEEQEVDDSLFVMYPRQGERIDVYFDDEDTPEEVVIDESNIFIWENEHGSYKRLEYVQPNCQPQTGILGYLQRIGEIQFPNFW